MENYNDWQIANIICYDCLEQVIDIAGEFEIEKIMNIYNKKSENEYSLEDYITIMNSFNELEDFYKQERNIYILNTENCIYFYLIGDIENTIIFDKNISSNIIKMHSYLHKFHLTLNDQLKNLNFQQKIEFIDTNLSKLSLFEDLPKTDNIPYKIINILKEKRDEIIACRPIYIVTSEQQTAQPEPYGSTSSLPPRASRIAEALGLSFLSLPMVASLPQSLRDTLFIKLSESSTSFVIALLDFLGIRKHRIFTTSTALYSAVAVAIEKSPDTVRQNFASLNEKSKSTKYHAFDQIESAQQFYNSLISR